MSLTDDSPDAGPAVAPRRRRWLAAAAVLSGVIGLALMLASENLGAGRIFDVTLHYPGIDKIAHLVQYTLVFLAVWWLLGKLVEGRAARAAAAATIALLLGVVDEMFQRSVANRSFENRRPGGEPVRGPARYRPWTGAALQANRSQGRRRGRDRRHCPRRPVVPAPAALQPRHAVQRARAISRRPWWNIGWRSRTGSTRRRSTTSWRGIEVESGTGDARAAVAYAARALAATPRNPDVLDTYGWALHHAGRSREALPLLERAFAGKPGMFCIHYHLGEVYGALGDGVRAERHLREQMRLFPRASEARRAEQSLRRRGLAVTGAPPATRTKRSLIGCVSSRLGLRGVQLRQRETL